MLITSVDDDARVIVGNEVAERHSTGERDGVKAVLGELICSELHHVSEVVVEREEACNRVPKIGDANMSGIDHIENITPIVSGVILVARKFRVLPSKLRVVTDIVFNERCLANAWVMLLNRAPD